jgi:hypothetical protein
MKKRITVVALVTILSLIAFRDAHAAAIDDIKVEVSNEVCDGSSVADKVFVVYATNMNSNKRISANFAYDSSPASQSFSLFNSHLAPFTDRFPKYHERRLAPGEKAKIGCTAIYRASSQPMIPSAIPITITKVGAVYVDPSKPDPPPELATDFVAFFPQTGFSACGGGGAGLRVSSSFRTYTHFSPFLLRSILSEIWESLPINSG